VAVPFAGKLADLIPPVAVRLRRDFKLLLTLIRAHALLHRATRDRDSQGRIVATVADYAAVRALVEKLFSEGIEATVPATIRETVAAVEACVERGAGEISLAALAQKMKLDKSAVHHRVRKAIERGFLVNHEEKRGMPARIATADPIPDEIEILPAPDALEDRCSVEATMEGIKKEEAEEDEDFKAERPEPLLPPDPHLNTSTPPPPASPIAYGALRPAATASARRPLLTWKSAPNAGWPILARCCTSWPPRARCGCTGSAADSGFAATRSRRAPSSPCLHITGPPGRGADRGRGRN
jgi:hypothetical protein